MTETIQVSPPTKGSEKTLKSSFPQYRQGAEMPGVKLADAEIVNRKRIIRFGKRKMTVPLPEYRNILSHESKIKLTPARTETPDTEKSQVDTSESTRAKNILALPRTLALKRTRDELVRQVRNTPKFDIEARRTLIAQGHARDELAEQYISGQKEVPVAVGDLGEQMAPYVILTPPETRRSEEQDGKPPIFMLVSISSGLDSMGMLPQELAFEGRNVVVIGFPESWYGEATDAFGKATEESSSYEPHTTFFKEAIRAIKEKQEVKDKIGDASEIELWGYSAGAAIVAEILTDKTFRGQVANAVIIAPPNCVDQKHVNISIFRELLQVVRPKNIKNAARLNVTNRHDIQYTEDHRKRMLRTFNAFEKKVLKRNNWWKNDLKVKSGGKITVVSYDSDQMTKSYKAAKEIAKIPNLTLVELPGSHNTPLTKPEILIDAVSKIAA